jgi:ankyrin repeat protein
MEIDCGGGVKNYTAVPRFWYDSHGGNKVNTQMKDFLELVKKGTPNQVQEAIEAGADLRAQDTDGWTALMWAAENNQNPEVIMTLLKAGADAKAKESVGETAFDYVQGNDKLKGTDAYGELEEASK